MHAFQTQASDFQTFTGPYQTRLDPMGPDWNLLDPTGRYWTLLDPTGSYYMFFYVWQIRARMQRQVHRCSAEGI